MSMIERKRIDWEVMDVFLKDKYGDLPQTDEMLVQLQHICRTLRDKNAILLAHYYQRPEIQKIADVTGDSLALAIAAMKPEYQDVSFIVSSTVHFMAEKIHMLSGKKTIIPDPEASCSIAEGMNGGVVRRIREAFPTAGIVGYINTTAETKAELDAVCTSANAQVVMEKIPGEQVIMVPDHYFAYNIAQKITPTRPYYAYRGIEEGNIMLYDVHHPDAAAIAIPLNGARPPKREKGTCIVHETFTPESIDYFGKDADEILAHPEVSPQVRDAVLMRHGVIGGTQRMIEYLKDKPDARKVLYLTECDMAEPLLRAYPKIELVTPCVMCEYMKRNTLQALMHAVNTEQFEVNVPPEIETHALRSLERMFELTGVPGPKQRIKAA